MVKKIVSFLDHFEELEDPRIDRKKLYSIEEILFTTLCAVICGAEGWQDVEDYGNIKIEYLRKYMPYEKGIPSDDTFRRFYRALDGEKFQQCFLSWIKTINIIVGENEVIAIDGKTSRHSFDKDKKAIHMISAFASEARIVLGQKKVLEKSNEITAIPELLEWLDIKGAIVTIDAMGCQHEVADKIINKKGNYIFALKGNQGKLNDDVRLFFEDNEILKQHKIRSHKEVDKGHGRIETRRCRVVEEISWLKQRHDKWQSIKSIIQIRAKIEKAETTTEETRYYISSLDADPKKILKAIRSHWSIENSLHWVLDMSFGEDQCRIRKGNAPHIMAILRQMALNAIVKAKTKRQSIKRLRKMAGWENAVLDNILSHF